MATRWGVNRNPDARSPSSIALNRSERRFMENLYLEKIIFQITDMLPRGTDFVK